MVFRGIRGITEAASHTSPELTGQILVILHTRADGQARQA